MPFEFYLSAAEFWIIPSIIAAMIASGKGRSFGKWFLLGLIISPVLAILVTLFLRKMPSKATIKKYAAMEGSEPPLGE